METSPQSEMWTNIVTNSLVGTGAFKRAAVCSLASGGVLACCPAEFTPSVEQVAALRDNFASRQVFSAAGFGLADTVFSLQEETATPEILCGGNAELSQGALVAKCNTVMLIGVYTEKLDQAMETLAELRTIFAGQGL